MSFKITVLTAFVSVDKDGEEGILAANLGGTYMPLICADEDRLSSMFPVAEKIKFHSGMDYKVIRFTERTDVTEEIKEKYGL